MSTTPQTYCLDANVLIQAWQQYYTPELCPGYWEILSQLGEQKRIFIPEAVYNEILRTDDDLTKWLKNSSIPIKAVNETVAANLKNIYNTDPMHKYLVDNIKGRSLADPWVIAHALSANATVVTKEEKVTAMNSNRIKIPNVCENMGVRCINDFQFVHELNIRFECKIV